MTTAAAAAAAASISTYIQDPVSQSIANRQKHRTFVKATIHRNVSSTV
jgi:hypothetical protein